MFHNKMSGEIECSNSLLLKNGLLKFQLSRISLLLLFEFFGGSKYLLY